MNATELETEEQEALFTTCLMAAFADGLKSETERSEIKRISETLNVDTLPVARIYHEVLYKRASLERDRIGAPDSQQPLIQ